MSDTLRLEQSRAYPVAVEDAYRTVLAAPLETVFARRYGVLPPVRAVTEQDGAPDRPWGAVGQSRLIRLADGGTMRERLTTVEPGREFGYVISDVTGAMRALVASVDGSWAFAPAGTGVRVTWSWTLHPASTAAGYALPAFGLMWRGYARQALEGLEGLLLPG